MLPFSHRQIRACKVRESALLARESQNISKKGLACPVPDSPSILFTLRCDIG